jgi:hypothetical protein
MLWRTRPTCGKRWPRGGQGGKQTFVGEGFHGGAHRAAEGAQKILIGGKLL